MQRANPAPLGSLRLAILVALVLLAALSRLLDLPPNFTPVLALGLFAGAYVQQRSLALLLPLAAMLLSDLILGAHSLMWVVYACIAACAVMGFALRGRVSTLRVIGGGVAGSVLFFVVTNFAVWAGGSMYPMTASGLLACYVAAIPFFQNSLVSTLLFCGLLFGSFEAAKARFPALRLQRAA